VERCRRLIADVTGALVSDGFIHSCLAKTGSLAADVVRLIRTLIAAAVAGFDETTLRSGPAGDKKYVHGAFTERYSAFWLGARSLEVMEDAGILPDFAGIVVSDRYQNYFNPRWKHVAGNQACLSHYPDTAVMPILGGLVLVGGGDRVRDIGIITGLRGRPAAGRAAGSGLAGLLAGWSGRGLAV